MNEISQILKAHQCGDYFENNENAVKRKYRETAKLIHPDICGDPRAVQAFEKLNKLYDQALHDIQHGAWTESNVVRLPGMGAIKYLNSIWTEFGKRYVTDEKVIWTFDSDKTKYKDCFVAALHRKNLTRFDRRLDEFKNRISRIDCVIDRAILVKKEWNEYPFDLFLSAYKEKLSDRDIAWMISRMCDLACFLYTAGMVHNGLEPTNLFINPDRHTISILGGWQYSVGIGQKMIGASREIFELMPLKARTTGIATSETDIESIRQMFQKIVHGRNDIPEPVMNWINQGSSNDAIHEFTMWDWALEKAYGERKFVKFNADANLIYSQE